MARYTHHFQDVDRTKLLLVGGKGANLGELFRISEVRVPDGFCVSTEAFKKIIAEVPSIRKRIEALSALKLAEQNKIRELTCDIRKAIERAVIPKDIRQEIVRLILGLGEEDSYAVRSSATAEDLPTASFAGQHDTFLNIIGTEAILKHITKCWASLFNERAVTYRLQHGFDHSKVSLAVVIQKMIFPKVSGVMFTADPVSGNRKVLSIDASFGLGEALVSGIVNADNYKVRAEEIISKKISAKKLTIAALESGGTATQAVEAEQQSMQALEDEQVLRLERTGRKIEAHFGAPQDIEWCLVDDELYIVQSRPITTLYPVPKTNGDHNHVYLSVGHQQMMTDPMKPLGLSIWQLMAAGRPMLEAGGRLFVDVSQMLASPATRDALLFNMGQFDPLIYDAVITVIEKGFVKSASDETVADRNAAPQLAPNPPVAHDASTVSDLISSSQMSIEALKNDIESKSGDELFDFIIQDIGQVRKFISDPKSMGLIMAAMNASSWINDYMAEWLGEKNVADVLSQSVPNNVTSEMGLQLLDVADVIRPFPDVIAYLQKAKDDSFFQELVKVEGGKKSLGAIQAFFDKYGMRCAGEIDITRPRWIEAPTTLVPSILNYVRNLPAGESKRRFEEGLRAALEKEKDLLHRLRQLPDGEQKAKEAKQKIDVIRNLSGYREYPKYSIINHLFIYKKALLKEAKRLVEDNILEEKNDIAWLTFQELHEVVKTGKLDYEVIMRRMSAHKLNEQLTPPRVITSEGEIVTGQYRRGGLPDGAIIGLAVSSGVIEGRARVILNMEEADLEEGDILVTAFTDPSWTPLFLSVRGLITEVGGLMTHGAVIAREYGLPAIVGVENATKIIKDGQRVRLNGTDGYVEIL